MKWLCGFAVSHIVTHYYAALHWLAWSVGLSVALSVCHTSEPCKNGWNDICIPDVGGPYEPRITWGPDANMGRGNFVGGNRQTIVKYRDTLRSFMQRQLNWSRCHLGCVLAWAESIMHYMGGPHPPWEGAILVDRGAHCKKIGLSVISCAKKAEPIHFPFRLWTRVGQRMHKFNFARWRQCALMEGHIATTCRITFNHPSMATMRFMSNYFDHLLSLDAPT